MHTKFPSIVLGKTPREEFAVMLKGFPTHSSGSPIHWAHLLVSCGLAEFSFGETAEDLLRRANEALYEAKEREKPSRIAKKQKSLWTNLKPFVPFRDNK
jgi:hypothetical protein